MTDRERLFLGIGIALVIALLAAIVVILLADREPAEDGEGNAPSGGRYTTEEQQFLDGHGADVGKFGEQRVLDAAYAVCERLRDGSQMRDLVADHIFLGYTASFPIDAGIAFCPHLLAGG